MAKSKVLCLQVITLGLWSGILVSCEAFHERKMRAAQRAVQTDLRQILQAEEAFHRENGFYTTDLLAMGAAPRKSLYKIGFVKPAETGGTVSHATVDPSRKDLDRVQKVGRIPIEYVGNKGEASLDFNAIAARFCPECTATNDSFKAVAIANLDADDELDIWTIDEKQQVRHVQNDLK